MTSGRRTFGKVWSALFWLFTALALAGFGIAIGRSVDSALLGFLAADFALLLVLLLATAGQGSPGHSQR